MRRQGVPSRQVCKRVDGVSRRRENAVFPVRGNAAKLGTRQGCVERFSPRQSAQHPSGCISAPLLPRDYSACRFLGSFSQKLPRRFTRQSKSEKGLRVLVRHGDKLRHDAFNKAAPRTKADFYICQNNTIYGTHYSKLPETGNVPLVADLSSCICSEPIDVSKYGLIFAGAQKNLGPAGVTIVIIREDLISEPMEFTPTMLRYDIHAKNNSLYNTPPCYGIYMCKLMFEWLKNDIGGLENMAKINRKKADILYSYLDSSKLFKPTVQGDSRSIMNVPFVTGDAELDAKFVKEAAAAGFVNLKGHRTVGGMRASIYNAMPVEGVEALVEFMKKFEAENA